MGWRERDYARFTKEEWDALTGTRSSVPRRAGRSSRDGLPWFLTAMLIVMVGTIMFLGRDALSPLVHRVSALASPTRPGQSVSDVGPPSSLRQTLTDQTNVILIRWREVDLVPAAVAGRICVTDSRHGRICAGYVTGERPADTLTRRISSLGLNVESG